jgi:hypothetical protein
MDLHKNMCETLLQFIQFWRNNRSRSSVRAGFWLEERTSVKKKSAGANGPRKKTLSIDQYSASDASVVF